MSGISRVIYALVGLAGLGLTFLGPMLRARGGVRGAPRAEARV
jgi:uncharacterized membrane protein YuzA (DUF378 family)